MRSADDQHQAFGATAGTYHQSNLRFYEVPETRKPDIVRAPPVLPHRALSMMRPDIISAVSHS